jgi:hypothetical protein
MASRQAGPDPDQQPCYSRCCLSAPSARSLSPINTTYCAPAVAAVTNATYGPTLSSTGTIVVWGAGFSPGGGNSVSLSPLGSADPVFTLDITTGSYFWDLSGNQINATVAGRITPGQWTLTVKNACGATSAGFAVTIQ